VRNINGVPPASIIYVNIEKSQHLITKWGEARLDLKSFGLVTQKEEIKSALEQREKHNSIVVLDKEQSLGVFLPVRNIESGLEPNPTVVRLRISATQGSD
jgi:hypothetical protein